MKILHISCPKVQKNQCIIPIQTLAWVKQMPSVGPFGIDQFSAWIVSQGQDHIFFGNTGPGDFSGKIFDKGEMKVRHLIKDSFFALILNPLPKVKYLHLEM